ncbi:MAG: crotonase/enoyl-CoA hydratase family protein [Acidimicrobiaceae bacterium]|nr:crotonase/enoyl-CoA hydratase family protein [Acidimicrobiaceae bacterium]
MSDAVLVEQRDRVLLITLNRPEARNAINAALAAGLLEAVHRLNEDPGLTAGVLTGNGPGFSSGMDLKAFVRGEEVGPPMMEFTRNGAEKPLIAAVEGFAVAGGLELALSCDLIVAAKGARLGIPEASRGLFAAGGGLVRLPNRVGLSKAIEMAITADPISAEEAADLGLVARLAEPGTAVEVALQLAERVARNAPLAVAASKQLIKRSQGLTEAEYWELQTQFTTKVFGSEDAKEGAAAFAEKRPPNWSGR